jgi:prepilin-type N-terminal cleavage/methylation domain-containing protein
VLKWIQEKDVFAETLTEFLVDSSDTFMKKQGIKPVSTQKASIKKAFTLTELLVSMAVLGLIATLTLPHMFMSADRAKKRAVFKEAYQALAQATHAAMMEGVADSRGIIPYFNAQKVCLNNSLTEGCIKDTTFAPGQALQQGVLLHSGVSIVGFNTGKDPGLSIQSNDTVVIGLENFAKKEYFRVETYVGDLNQPKTLSYLSGDLSSGKTSGKVVQLRPGDIVCADEACLDMFKKD